MLKISDILSNVRKKRTLLVCAVLALVLVLVLFLGVINNIFATQSSPSASETSSDTAAPFPTAEPSPTVIPDYTVANHFGSEFSGGGKFTQQGDYLYYINDGGIYKQPVKGGTPTLITRQEGCSCLNVIGDNVYFIKNGGIYSADIYSGNTELIYSGTSSATVKKLVATNQYLYFSMQNSLIRYDLSDGTTRTLIYSMQDFELCGSDVIIITQNSDYGLDLTLLSGTSPIASQVAAYTIDNGIIYAETTDGMMAFDSSKNYEGSSMPISFEMVPSAVYSVDACLLYLPRNSRTVYRVDKLTGNTHTIIDNVDEFYCVWGSIIYRSNDTWYSCSSSGWQRGFLTDGLAVDLAPATLSCSTLEFRLYDSIILSLGQSASLSLLVNGQPATSAQLQMLSCYIKDNTVLTYEITGEVITVTAKAQGSTVLRVASSEKTVFAEVLVTVE